MAHIDLDSLAEHEREAKLGRADALYNLGLAYSTGQSVQQDYIAAHKWFNLAALRGSDNATSWRHRIAEEMSTGQIAEAQKLAREWLNVFTKASPT
jgi:TPR repeat protein